MSENIDPKLVTEGIEKLNAINEKINRGEKPSAEEMEGLRAMRATLSDALGGIPDPNVDLFGWLAAVQPRPSRAGRIFFLDLINERARGKTTEEAVAAARSREKTAFEKFAEPLIKQAAMGYDGSGRRITVDPRPAPWTLMLIHRKRLLEEMRKCIARGMDRKGPLITEGLKSARYVSKKIREARAKARAYDWLKGKRAHDNVLHAGFAECHECHVYAEMPKSVRRALGYRV